MIADEIADMFERMGYPWFINGGKDLHTPSGEDVQRVLDTAAAKLYDGVVGDRLEVAGLIIEKAERGYNVYAYVGNYE